MDRPRLIRTLSSHHWEYAKQILAEKGNKCIKVGSSYDWDFWLVRNSIFSRKLLKYTLFKGTLVHVEDDMINTSLTCSRKFFTISRSVFFSGFKYLLPTTIYRSDNGELLSTTRIRDVSQLDKIIILYFDNYAIVFREELLTDIYNSIPDFGEIAKKNKKFLEEQVLFFALQ